jgi:hypothetical protein
MRYKADLSKNTLIVESAQFRISNTVRSLKNGTRKSCEVIRSIPDSYPYDPMTFPLGIWRITGVEWQKDKNGKALFDFNTYGPVKIRTDAWQWVKIWELDKDGDYLREWGGEVKDHGYLLHYNMYNTTLGCIRLATPEDAIMIGNVTQKFLEQKQVIELEVIRGV